MQLANSIRKGNDLVGDVFIIAGSVAAALVFVLLISRLTLAPTRKESNDFTGAVVTVIGTTYAVILAFMLWGVWSLYQGAQANEEEEANDLVNLYRLANQLPEPEKGQIQSVAAQYAHFMLDSEWPALAKGELPPQGGLMIDKLWQMMTQIDGKSPAQALIVAELLTDLRALTEHRQVRIMESREALPGILWTILIAGGIITVSMACFFGVTNIGFHILQVVVLAFLISLVLVAILEIDQPYQGGQVVSPDGFRYALQIFNQVQHLH